MKAIVHKALFLFIMCLGMGVKSFSQNTYRVYFTDKNNTEYHPYDYLHPKAIERRILNQLDLCDSSDFPLNHDYCEAVALYCDTVKGHSRWMNMMLVMASEQNIEKIKTLSFVKNIDLVTPPLQNGICQRSIDFDTSLTQNTMHLLQSQLHRMKGHKFTSKNLTGKGLRIAILDAGFKSVDTNPAFDHIRRRNGIVATYDFVKKRENVNNGMAHGAHVFSCLGGQIGGYTLGLATGADYLLARTEGHSENFKEEEYWLMAAEWADKHGADIINSSLGYTYQRYLPEDMDGKTSFVSKAAQMAVDKGILVVCSAGNEGSGTWKRITAPGDAEGVLTVGGINPRTGLHSGFSSYGPSWDKRLKPEVCAYSTAVVSGQNGFTISEGTSFSSPLVAGFAACIKQQFPELKNSEIKERLCRSADLWPYFDYAHGYGVPQADFLELNPKIKDTSFAMKEEKYTVSIFPLDRNTSCMAKDSIDPAHSITNNNPYSTSLPDYMFYHIKNKKGYIDKYYVLNVHDKSNTSISVNKLESDVPFTIECFYKGFYQQLHIKE